MSDQITAKTLVKAVRQPAYNAGLEYAVRYALTNMGIALREDKLKIDKGYNQTDTVSVADVRNALGQIPSEYRELRDAVTHVIAAAEVNDAPANATASDVTPHPAGDVNLRDLVALVKRYADHHEWCADVEAAMSETMDLRFDPRNADDGHRCVLRRGNPETVTREQVRDFLAYAHENHDGTYGVGGLLGEVTTRFLEGGTPAQTNAQAPVATSTSGRYTVTIETTLTAEQLTAIGVRTTGDPTGARVNYSGITGRITSAQPA